MVALMKFTYTADAKPVDGYTIRRGIHRGGFGEVYYAVSDAGKEVALKLLTHDLDTELRGVRQCLNLKHPNLVTTFDVKTDADGDHWVIMEYIQGASLEDVLRSFPHGLPETEVGAWMKGLLDGVEFLHQRGIVHRDLKPANVYRENGHVKIGDVGLSKQMGGGGRRNQHTEAVGTVYYMAPEVAKGQYGPEVDVYSLGVMLYEMVTGRLPFDGETTAEILMKHLSARPDLSLLPTKLRPIIAHALEKDPTKRTPTVSALRDELRGFQAVEALSESAFVPQPTNGHTPRSLAETPTRLGDTDRRRTPLPESRRPRHRHEWHGTRSNPESSETESMPGWKIALIVGAFVMPFPFLIVAIFVFFGPWMNRQLVALADVIAMGVGRTQTALLTSASRVRSPAVWPWLLIGGVLLIPWRQIQWDRFSSEEINFTTGFVVFWVWLLWLILRLARTAVPTAASTMPSAANVNGKPAYSRAEVWAVSMLTGVASSVTIAAVGWTVCRRWFYPAYLHAQQPSELLLFFAVLAAVMATITMLTAAHVSRHVVVWPRWGFAMVGLLTGAMVGGLQQFLDIPMHTLAPPSRFALDAIGPFGLAINGQPSPAAYMIFFGFLATVASWGKMLNPLRERKLSGWSVVWTAASGYLGALLFGLPVVDAVVWSGTVAAAVQLAAPWQPRELSSRTEAV